VCTCIAKDAFFHAFASVASVASKFCVMSGITAWILPGAVKWLG